MERVRVMPEGAHPFAVMCGDTTCLENTVRTYFVCCNSRYTAIDEAIRMWREEFHRATLGARGRDNLRSIVLAYNQREDGTLSRARSRLGEYSPDPWEEEPQRTVEEDRWPVAPFWDFSPLAELLIRQEQSEGGQETW